MLSGSRTMGIIPNNPKLPLVLYRSPVRLLGKFDPAAVFEELFERNGWGDSWRNGIYDYAHYNSRIHEVLGVAWSMTIPKVALPQKTRCTGRTAC
jgi:uncharacterized protein YjlB